MAFFDNFLDALLNILLPESIDPLTINLLNKLDNKIFSTIIGVNSEFLLSL